jgi:uncharacterized protein YecE (DUF72 family)
LASNPHFLSVELMEKFMERLEPMAGNLGPLVFQFEYLNKQKMPGSVQQFIDRFGEFAAQLPGSQKYCIETRNPNYLQNTYFDFLKGSGLHHVFLQGYYMLSIFDIYRKYGGRIRDCTVIRLHGPDRKGIEEKTGKDWSQVVNPKNQDINSLTNMSIDLRSRNIESFVYVNNHFEGSGPRTIMRIKEVLNINS